MPSIILVFRSRAAVVSAFEEVVRRWRLSASEIDCVRGTAFPDRGRARGRQSRFVVERMSLVVEIDARLTALMDQWLIPDWLRDQIHPAFRGCPLDDMFGSTDRLRRIRDLLEPEVRQ